MDNGGKLVTHTLTVVLSDGTKVTVYDPTSDIVLDAVLNGDPGSRVEEFIGPHFPTLRGAFMTFEGFRFISEPYRAEIKPKPDVPKNLPHGPIKHWRRW